MTMGMMRKILLWTATASACTAWILPTRIKSPSVLVLRDSRIPDVYPASTRRAILLQKIQQQQQVQERIVNDASVGATTTITTNDPTVSYSYGQPGWSNRFGSVLTPAAIPGVYTADRPFYWNSIDVGCRMTVIELQPENGGGLFVHSPIALDGPLFKLLETWGQPVKYVVSPNYEHVKFATQWHQAFPEAQMWACPGLMERIPQIKWTGEIPYGYRPPGFAKASPDKSGIGWEPEIQALHIDTEVNPFTGKPFFNECIFYHQPSQSLLTTDLYWNYPPRERRVDDDPELIPPIEAVPWKTSLWKFGMDQVFQPFYMNLMTRDKERLEQIGRFLVDGKVWNVETLIPAHGDTVRGSEKIASVLQEHFNLN